jgi:hypothetical protein
VTGSSKAMYLFEGNRRALSRKFRGHLTDFGNELSMVSPDS